MCYNKSRFALLFWALSLFFLTALAACTRAQGSAGSGNIAGGIKDATSFAGIPGAILSLTGSSLTAASNSSGSYIGDYSFGTVPVGSYTVTVSAPGYQSASQLATVTAGGTAFAQFQLSKKGGTSTGAITGLVTDTFNKVVSGATVAAGGLQTVTDTTGHYTLTAVAAGAQTLTASNSLYLSASISVTVIQGSTVTASTLKLTPNSGSGNITGGVKDTATWAGIPGATLSLTGRSAPAASNSSGSYIGDYSFGTVPVGSYTVTASAPGYQSASMPATVTAGGTTFLQFKMAKGGGGAITGLVTDTFNKVVSGATVAAGGLQTVTDTTGHYTLTAVAAGAQTLTASNSLYLSASISVTVIQGSTVTASTLKLTPNSGNITGSVKDAVTFAGIPGAVVSLPASGLSTVTDAGGNYSFGRAPVGGYSVTASAIGYQATSVSTSVSLASTAAVNFSLSAAVNVGNTIRWNGSNSYLFGANYAWYNYGTDFGTGGWGKYTDWNGINNGFAALKAQGAHVVRYWVFADGRYSPEFNANGSVSGLDSFVLSDIDKILGIANANGIYLLLTVVDSAMWSNAGFSGSVQTGGHSSMVTDMNVQQTFLDKALKPLLQHVVASPYKNNVLGYEIVSEPEGNMAGYWGGVNLPASQVQTFVKNCAAYIHTYGGGAYATVGSATPYYVNTWKNLGLDFYQIHYYPWMDFGQAAGSGLPTCASLNLDKPCIVGEYASADVNYTLGSITPLSAQWYLDSIYTKGYAGALAWSFTVHDSATNWAGFQPIFTNWATTNDFYLGPK